MISAIGLAGLVLLAGAVRLYWGLQARVVWGDEPYYLWLGRSLLSGGGYYLFPPGAGFPGISGVHFAPLFPLLAAMISAQIGGLAAGSVALYAICGALLVLPVYGLARQLAGRRAALASGLATALYPALTAGVPLWGTMTEPLYLLLVAVAWWALLVGHKTQERSPTAYVRNALWSGLAGAALGLAYLTRTEALVYLVAGLAMVFLLLVLPGRSEPGSAAARRASVGNTLAGIGVALALFALVISPYLVALHTQTGRWQLTEEAGSTYVSARGLAFADVAAFDKATWGLDISSASQGAAGQGPSSGAGEVYLFSSSSEGQGLLAAIAADPRGFARLLWLNSHTFLTVAFSARLIPWPLAALAALGLFARPWDLRRLRGELLLMAALAGPLSFLLFFIQPRYLAGALIPALVWIGGGVAWLGEWLVETWAALTGRIAPHRPPVGDILRIAPACVLALALLWQAPRLWAVLQQTNSFQPGHLAAAAELRALGVSADTVVMSRYPAIAFHARTRWAPTPAASWPEVVDYARSRSARYLVMDAWEGSLRPQLAFLLTPQSAPSGLNSVASLDAGHGIVVIYEFE